MSTAGDAPPEIEDRLREICLALPDAYQEQAWVGTRWRVRKRTFAHVLTVDREWPAAYAKAATLASPACVVTFRSPAEEMGALLGSGYPYFRAGWGYDVVGTIVDAGQTDWDEVAELLTDSYCVLAPKKLVGLVHR
jgi:predicted DNA-binding protein (MmcQ/YjbR family)